MRVFVPQDSISIALGADLIANKIVQSGHEIIRNSSRGLHFLEVLIEVEIDGARHCFGPISTNEIDDLIANNFTKSHPKYLGIVDELKLIKAQNRFSFAKCGINDPLDFDGYLTLGGGKALEKAKAIGAQKTIDEIKSSGLRGRGGAGFPAAIKWQTVKDAQSNQKYIICNADEGDSGNFADRAYMEGDPFGLIEAMAIAGFALGASKGYIYVRSEYPIAIKILKAAIEIAKQRGLLENFDLEVFVGAGAYVCGEETALLESIEGKRGMVRAKPPIPALEGLFGKPTLVNNVLTFAAIAPIILNGGVHYAGFGTGRSLGTIPIQLSGNIKNGGYYELPFGMTLRELIYDIGGGIKSGREFGAVQIGGPLGAYFTAENLDLIFDYEILAQAGGILGHGSLVVFDDTIDFLKMARFAFEFCAHESCGKCTPCRIGSTRGVETMDRIIAGENQYELVDDLCETMKFGSLCALGGFTPYPVQSAIRAWRGKNV